MLLNISMLKSNVNEKIFNEGLGLYLNNKIDFNNLIKIDLGNEIKYTYQISSLEGNYSVVIKVIKKENEYHLSGCMCKCFYCSNNKAICSHIIAVCLIIMDFLNYGNEGIDLLSSEYYKEEKQRKLLNLFTSPEYNNIKLRPNIIIENKNVYMRLYIYSEKEYIIPNVNLFLEAINYNKSIKYGKKLEFIHNLNCFNSKAIQLINLLFISKLEYNNKNIIINNYILEEVLNIFRDEIMTMSINNSIYKINNSLKEQEVSVIVDEKDVKLNLEKHLYLMKSNNKIIYINEDNTNVINLNYYEVNFVHNLIDNNLDITTLKDFFFSKIYPRIKRIVSLSKEIEEQFPVYDVTINSYFDLNDSKIELKTQIFENDKEVNKNELEVLSKVIYFEYEELLSKYYFNNNVIKDATYVVDFLHADLSKFKEYGEVYLSERVKKANIKRTGKFSLGINYNLNLLELNIDSKLSNEELEEILESYRNKEKYVILKDNSIIELDDDVKELSRIVEEYALDYKDLKTPKLKPSYNILNLLKEDIDQNSVSILNDFTEYNNKEIYPIEKINNVVRPYQLEAFRWLSNITEYGFGGLLADDMGLGKSLEILSLILTDDVQKPSIIISPMSLVYNWCNEITKWGNEIKVNIVIGNAKDRSEVLKQIDYNKKEIYLVSYDILKKDYEQLKDEFRFVIIDEAQYIKNKNTKTAISVKQLNAQVRFALTGTPIENSLSDLWSIFDFILPNYLNSYNKFKDEYEVVSDNSSLELLQKKVSPFILRRTKKDVLHDLPDKIEEIYYTTLSSKQQELYDAYLNKARNSLSNSNEIEILSILTRLRQICVSPKMFLANYLNEEVKIDLAMDLINKAISGDHKVLLFSQFTSSFDVLSKRLESNDIPFYTLTGKTSAKDRVSLSNDFNSKDDVRVFLISLKAGGTGLNLYGADTVIHLDPWWNLSAESQATDRAHRIGQKKVLNVIKIICANTIEEKVLQLQSYKAQLSSKIIDSENKNKKLNIKDLEFLLS